MEIFSAALFYTNFQDLDKSISIRAKIDNIGQQKKNFPRTTQLPDWMESIHWY